MFSFYLFEDEGFFLNEKIFLSFFGNPKVILLFFKTLGLNKKPLLSIFGSDGFCSSSFDLRSRDFGGNN